MPKLSKYLFMQMLGATLIGLIMLGGMAWMTQALRILERIIGQSSSAMLYLELTLLSMPRMLAIIFPIALFFGILYVLNRLFQDSELIAIFASGISPWQIARPVLLLAFITSLLIGLLSLYVSPHMMRILYAQQNDLQNAIAANLVREGSFTTPSEHLTVYAQSRTGDGAIRGLLVHDNRDAKHPVTYLAEEGVVLRAANEPPRFLLRNGNIHRRTETGIQILSFSEYSYDLSPFIGGSVRKGMRASERFLPQLLFPNMDNEYDRRRAHKLRANGHDKIVSLLHPITLALIALITFTHSGMSRRRYGRRIMIGSMTGLAYRVLCFAVVGQSAKADAAIWPIYFVPVFCLILCIIVMSSSQHNRWASKLSFVKGGV